MQAPLWIELLATILFVLAILHTFTVAKFQKIAAKARDGSLKENLFHLLGEVEVVFGIWAAFLFVGMILLVGRASATAYVEGLNFTEPLFVFAIMVVAATRPVISAARSLIEGLGRALPLPREMAIYLCCLSIGPLLGSLITEPAAMTVTALLLRDRYFARITHSRFQYLTLAVLFVNVSIGGVLTHFAAPPVLMVAAKWGWTTSFMWTTFGWKALIAVLINAGIATFINKDELKSSKAKLSLVTASTSSPWPLIALHLLFLVLIVMNAHHPVLFMGLLLFFLGLMTATKEYQDEAKIRQALLVAFFLGGLVVLGGLQAWWIDPLLRKFSALPLFLGTTALTAVTDNAALTYLGSFVEGSSDLFKYALVAGAVAGGGLTVIANAPNPAGYSILNPSFGDSGIRPMKLLKAAVIPTVVAMLCLWLL